MVIAALVTFGALVAAWILAPDEPPAPILTSAVEPEPLAAAA